MKEKHSTQELVGRLFRHCMSTFHHSLRVGDELFRFSSFLGMENTKEIYLLGILHDIGKLNIPSSLLNKTTPLTSTEFQEIKRHTEYGKLLIEQFDVLPAGYSDCAKYHHENVDGSGYFGLKGEEIPLLSRMIRIIDSADTMMYGRIYQNPSQQEEILSEIYDLSGKHYDKKLVKSYFDFLKKYPQQMEELYLKEM